MTAPTIYRSDDPGAPVTTNDVKNAMYNVLRACLVDGYAGKPTAGWSVVYDVWATDGVCTFTNAAQSGVLGVAHNSYANFGPIVFTAAAMIDAITGVNVRSGIYDQIITDLTNSGATEADGCLVAHRNKLAAANHWCVIANENFCVAFFSSTFAGLFDVDHVGNNYNTISHIFFGAAESLVGLGGVSSASTGNFVQLGAGREGTSESIWRLGSTNHGTACVGGDGGNIVGTAYTYVTPYGDAVGGLGVSVPDFIRRLRLVPLSVWVAEGSSAKGGAKQTAEVPMLRATPSFGYGGTAYFVMSEFNAVSLTDVLTIDGKNYLWAPLIYGDVVFISLDAGDWQ